MPVPLLTPPDFDAGRAPEAQPPVVPRAARAFGAPAARTTVPAMVPNTILDAGDDEPLVDVARLRDLAGFPVRAVRRHARLARGIFGATAATALLGVLIAPRTYHVETRLLAERNVVMPLLGNPRRAVPTESDAPTRLAAEAVLRRENLVRVIRDADLLRHWSEIRSPAGRLKEAAVSLVRPPLPDSERVAVLVEVLEKKLWVSTATENSDGTVTIGVDWPEPRTAFAIVQAAQQNFLLQRQESEIGRITESIAILERHVASAHEAIDQALGTAPPVADLSTAAPAISTGPAPVPPTPAAVPTSQQSDLEAALAAKEGVLQDLEATRTRRIGELRSRLADLRGRYGAAHPEVQAAQEALAAVTAESPQLAALRADARAIRDRLTAIGAPAPSVRTAYRPRPAGGFARTRLGAAEDPRRTYADSRLKIATADYEDLLDRLEGARIELETARAAFKYRYSVLAPAELPKRAVKPNVPVLLVGGVLLGALLALFGATAADVAAGRVLEAWQVEQALGLSVLGRMRRP